jgi:hypothetical protein
MEAHRFVRRRGFQNFYEIGSQMALRSLELIYVKGWVDPKKDYVNWKKELMNSSGIEPATFQLLAYCLNQLRYRVIN